MRTVIGSMPRNFLRLVVPVLAFSVFLATSSLTASAKQPYSGIVMDAKTGKVLYSYRGDSRAYPASLTKMMTLYMLFEALEQGRVSKLSRIQFSKHAASMVPSKLGIGTGGSISVEQAIYALVTKSANDAAAAVAETLAGTEWEFAQQMTNKARALGMKNTTFRNASGLPDSNQVTTAKDMAILGVALREHYPQYFDYFSTRIFKFGKYRYGNHNRLLGKVRGMDGIKTGYTRASGFNLVSSVETGGRSIVAVVMGGRTGASRNAQMVKIIKENISKASRGADLMVVQKPSGQSLYASLFKNKGNAPLPSRRPTIDTTKPAVTANAYVAESTSTANVSAPTPPTDLVKTSSIKRSSDAQAQTASSVTSDPAGWQIQIGAMPSRASALDRLAIARKKAPKLLQAVSDYTETVESNGAILHRARFAGFSSKTAAWDACAVLKKKDFACLALRN